jgi:copper chaperone
MQVAGAILYPVQRTRPYFWLFVCRTCPLWALLLSTPMKTLQFKTNINCGGCIKAVTPTLNGEKAITSWQVDTANPNKVLTVTGDITEEQILALVEDAGFKAEKA